jgi:hypothetical protein
VDHIIEETKSMIENSEHNAIQKLQLFFEKQLSIKKPKIVLMKYFSQGKKDSPLLYKYNNRIWQKHVDPLTKIVQQGVNEGVFDIQHPFETVDILIRTVSSLSSLENELLQDKEKFFRYVSSLQSIFIKTLGIDEGVIQMIDEEVLSIILNKSEGCGENGIEGR